MPSDTAEFDNVISASYISNEKQNITVDQDLDQYPFPIGKPLWLHTGKSTVTVSGDGMERYRQEQGGLPASGWAQEELDEAVAAGVTDGQRPQGLATRQEVAIMVMRGKLDD